MSYVNETWFDHLLDWIDELFDSSKNTKANNEDENNAKVILTLEEAKSKLEEMKNSPHLTSLKRPYVGYYNSGDCVFGYNVEDMLNTTALPSADIYSAKDVFEKNNILLHDIELNNFATLSCDETITDGSKNCTVKIFKGWANNKHKDSAKNVKIVYYGNINKYALIVTHNYYRDYISNLYDDLAILQKEVLTLANIIKLEKEIEIMEAKEKAKRLEEVAWG